MGNYRTVRTERGTELVWEARSAATSYALYGALLAGMGAAAFAGAGALSAGLPQVKAAIAEAGRAKHGKPSPSPAAPDPVVASR